MLVSSQVQREIQKKLSYEDNKLENKESSSSGLGTTSSDE